MKTKITNISKSDEKTLLRDLYENSAFTISDYKPEELDSYLEKMQKDGYLCEKYIIYATKGAVLNKEFRLRKSPLPADADIFIIPLEYLREIGKLALSGVYYGWFGDYHWLDELINDRYAKRRKRIFKREKLEGIQAERASELIAYEAYYSGMPNKILMDFYNDMVYGPDREGESEHDRFMRMMYKYDTIEPWRYCIK